MKDYRREFPVGMMCKVLKVSRSAFYQSQKFIPSHRDGENRILTSEIMRIHTESKATYGSLICVGLKCPDQESQD